jgi:hypothetical protein
MSAVAVWSIMCDSSLRCTTRIGSENSVGNAREIALAHGWETSHPHCRGQPAPAWEDLCAARRTRTGVPPRRRRA